MNESTKNLRAGLLIFALAALVTFSFICLMQFVPIPWFFLVLVLMHVGIFAFIMSKRLLRKAGVDTRAYFRRQYLLLLPYLIVMFYTFASRFGLLVMHSEAKMIFTLVYTALCLAFTVWNFMVMTKDFNVQLIENPAVSIPKESPEGS